MDAAKSILVNALQSILGSTPATPGIDGKAAAPTLDPRIELVKTYIGGVAGGTRGRTVRLEDADRSTIQLTSGRRGPAVPTTLAKRICAGTPEIDGYYTALGRVVVSSQGASRTWEYEEAERGVDGEPNSYQRVMGSGPGLIFE